jgi:uncharacterized membrane protein
VVDAPVGSASVVIRRAAADVFAFVTTPENDPLWVRVCKGIRRLGAEPIRVGARLIEQVGFLGFVVPYTWEVTRFEPGRAITYSSRKGIVPMVITIAIESDGDSTRVTQQIELRVPRGVPFTAAIATMVARREAERNLAMLKQRLEGTEPTAGTGSLRP